MATAAAPFIHPRDPDLERDEWDKFNRRYSRMYPQDGYGSEFAELDNDSDGFAVLKDADKIYTPNRKYTRDQDFENSAWGKKTLPARRGISRVLGGRGDVGVARGIDWFQKRFSKRASLPRFMRKRAPTADDLRDVRRREAEERRTEDRFAARAFNRQTQDTTDDPGAHVHKRNRFVRLVNRFVGNRRRRAVQREAMTELKELNRTDGPHVDDDRDPVQEDKPSEGIEDGSYSAPARPKEAEFPEPERGADNPVGTVVEEMARLEGKRINPIMDEVAFANTEKGMDRLTENVRILPPLPETSRSYLTRSETEDAWDHSDASWQQYRPKRKMNTDKGKEFLGLTGNVGLVPPTKDLDDSAPAHPPARATRPEVPPMSRDFFSLGKQV